MDNIRDFLSLVAEMEPQSVDVRNAHSVDEPTMINGSIPSDSDSSGVAVLDANGCFSPDVLSRMLTGLDKPPPPPPAPQPSIHTDDGHPVRVKVYGGPAIVEADTRKVVLEQEQLVTSGIQSPNSENIGIQIVSTIEDFQSYAGEKPLQAQELPTTEKNEHEARSKYD